MTMDGENGRRQDWQWTDSRVGCLVGSLAFGSKWGAFTTDWGKNIFGCRLRVEITLKKKKKLLPNLDIELDYCGVIYYF